MRSEQVDRPSTEFARIRTSRVSLTGFLMAAVVGFGVWLSLPAEREVLYSGPPPEWMSRPTEDGTGLELDFTNLARVEVWSSDLAQIQFELTAEGSPGRPCTAATVAFPDRRVLITDCGCGPGELDFDGVRVPGNLFTLAPDGSVDARSVDPPLFEALRLELEGSGAERVGD